MIIWARFDIDAFQDGSEIRVIHLLLQGLFEIYDVQSEHLLQEWLLDGGIWGGGSNFSTLHPNL